jgi:drug/metabolite transporter (DMT)-like permease
LDPTTVVAPFFQAAPLFGYALSYVVLGERLTFSQAFGGLMIIGGTTYQIARTNPG